LPRTSGPLLRQPFGGVPLHSASLSARITSVVLPHQQSATYSTGSQIRKFGLQRSQPHLEALHVVVVQVSKHTHCSNRGFPARFIRTRYVPTTICALLSPPCGMTGPRYHNYDVIVMLRNISFISCDFRALSSITYFVLYVFGDRIKRFELKRMVGLHVNLALNVLNSCGFSSNKRKICTQH